MSPAEEATAHRPPRRRAPWSLRSIVIDVTGRPISEFQELPPSHARSPSVRPHREEEAGPDIDPVDRFSPPLSGARGRAAHGLKLEHHADTIERHRPSPEGSGRSPPAAALHPERLYLHYLLLHLDRLTLPSLWYLRRQVNEEIASRARPRPSPPHVE